MAQFRLIDSIFFIFWQNICAILFMKKLKVYITILLLALLIPLNLQSQFLLNGDFEKINNLHSNYSPFDSLNLTNNQINKIFPNFYAFGKSGNIDIIGTKNFSINAYSGNFYIAITGGSTDQFSLEISQTLKKGDKYDFGFYSKAFPNINADLIQIGISDSKDKFGTLIYSQNTITKIDKWEYNKFFFVVPFDAKYITVRQLGDISTWVQLDKFVLGCEEKIEVNLQNDTVLCDGQICKIGKSIPNVSYQWNNGSQDSVLYVNKSGLYILDVFKDNCIFRDSVKVDFVKLADIQIKSNLPICQNDLLILEADSVENYTYKWISPDGTMYNQRKLEIKTDSNKNDGNYKLIYALEDCSNFTEIKVESNKFKDDSFEFIYNKIDTIEVDEKNNIDFSIKNVSKEILEIKKIELVDIQNSTENLLDLTLLAPNQNIVFNKDLLKNIPGKYDLKIKVYFSLPCDKVFEFPISRIIKAKVKLSLQDHQVKPGSEIIIQPKIKFSKSLNLDSIKISYNLCYNSSVIQIRDSNYLAENDLDNKLSFVKDSLIVKNTNLGEYLLNPVLCQVFLGDSVETKFYLNNIKISNEFIDYDIETAKLILDGCSIGLRLVKIQQATTIELSQNNQKANLFSTKIFSEEEGEFELIVYNFLAQEVYSKKWINSESGEKIVDFNLDDSSTNFYFVCLRTPMNKFTKKIMYLGTK